MSDSATAASEKGVPQSERGTPQIAFGSMAGILTSESEKFLQTFLNSARAAKPNSIPDDLLLRFLPSADSFTVSCCDRLSSFLREVSIQGEVRGTSESVLARLARNRCFEAMDTMLAEYLDSLKQAGLDVTQTVKLLADSRVRDLSVTSGQADDPGGQQEKRKLQGSQNARALALIKIHDYFGALGSLPHDFLDYGSSKLFGGDVDFTMQQRFLRTIADSMHEKLSNAKALVEGFEAVKQRKWEQQRAVETATIKAVAMIATQSQTKRKTGFSSLVIAACCAAPIWFLLNLGMMNRYLIGLAAGFGIAALVFLFRGIFHLTKT